MRAAASSRQILDEFLDEFSAGRLQRHAPAGGCMVHEGDLLHGFTVKSVEWIEEYHGYGICCLHNATGLELFHLL